MRDKPLKPRSNHVTVKFTVCTAVTLRSIIVYDVTPYTFTDCSKKRTVLSFKVMDVKKEAAGYLEKSVNSPRLRVVTLQ